MKVIECVRHKMIGGRRWEHCKTHPIKSKKNSFEYSKAYKTSRCKDIFPSHRRFVRIDGPHKTSNYSFSFESKLWALQWPGTMVFKITGFLSRAFCLQLQYVQPHHFCRPGSGHPHCFRCTPRQQGASGQPPLQPWSSLLVCQPRQGQRVRDDLLVCQQTAALSRAASRDCQQPAATRSQPVQPWSSLLVRQSRQGQGVRHDLLVLVEVDVNTSVTAKE